MHDYTSPCIKNIDKTVDNTRQQVHFTSFGEEPLKATSFVCILSLIGKGFLFLFYKKNLSLALCR